MNTRSVVALRRVSAVIVVTVAITLTAACSGEEGIPLTLTGDRGDRGDGEFIPVDYELTSDTYKKWLVAQENLRRDAGDADLGLPAQRVLLTNPSAESIDGVVTELERSAQTRDAIRSAGLSVRNYVLATLALYQATDHPDTLGLEPGGVPIRATNVDFARRHADEIRVIRESSPVRFVDDRPRGKRKGKAKGRDRDKDDDDDDDDRGRGRGRGNDRDDDGD